MTSVRGRQRWSWLLLAILAGAATSVPRTGAAPADVRGPGVRNGHGLAFDGRVSVLFGGADDRGLVTDTWGWDGSRWRRFDVVGPPMRTFPVMVGTGTGALLFGGRRVLFGAELASDQMLDDLWRWNGQAWSRVEARGPSARAEAAAAWDPRRRRVVMFGGYRIRDGRLERLGDTWEFDVTGQWHEATTVGPSPRHGATAFYDPALAEVVLFGGSGALGDTWAWNGVRWRRVGAEVPRGRYNAAGASGDGRVPAVRFGGWDGSRRSRDTWWLVGGEWLAGPNRGPGARNHSAMTFDVGRGRYVLFGGHDGARVFGDLWELDAAQWRRLHTTPARWRLDNGH